jgi:hypothetical protein
MQKTMPIVLLSCKVFQNLLEIKYPAGFLDQVIFLDYGLHSVPRNLKTSLQASLDAIETPSLVVLGFGLCGNGLDGIQSGIHTLLVPRSDDCIAILLGSYQVYLQQFQSIPGTYYLTKGWLEAGSNPLAEHQKYVDKYGQEMADWLMDQQYQHYKRLAFVAHNPEDLNAYHEQALAIARFCERWGMKYEEISGSEEYLSQLVRVTQSLEQAGEDFLVIPPGRELLQEHFRRA